MQFSFQDLATAKLAKPVFKMCKFAQTTDIILPKLCPLLLKLCTMLYQKSMFRNVGVSLANENHFQKNCISVYTHLVLVEHCAISNMVCKL